MSYQEQARFAHDVSKLINYIFDQGYFVTLGEAFRTKEQAEIYAKEGKGIKDSLHCERLAIDLNLFTPDGKYLTTNNDYAFLGQFWESLDKKNRWGGKFRKANGDPFYDSNHFERHI